MEGIVGSTFQRGGGTVQDIGQWPDNLWMILPSSALGAPLRLRSTPRPETEGHGTDAAIKAFHREACAGASRSSRRPVPS